MTITNIAKTKTNKVKFNLGTVENMPYKENFFDFISNNYAFHHYENKKLALDEIYRVLAKNGVYKMHNISIYDMKSWWIYNFFPTAYEEDKKRFWDKDVIYNELINRSFDVKLHVNYKRKSSKVIDFIEYVRNKDISILTLISESDYKIGIEKMDMMIQLNKNATIINDYAVVDFIATKR